jgi:hypothetical protein
MKRIAFAALSALFRSLAEGALAAAKIPLYP